MHKTRISNLCPTCGNRLERKIGPLKYRSSSSLDNHYPGTLLATIYFWCTLCSKGYVKSEECGSDLNQERARSGKDVYVVAPITEPTKPVQVVDWLK